MVMKDLESIFLTSGVNEEGKGFITITATSKDKEQFFGQVDPETCRSLGRQYFEVAEAAETDSMLYKLLQGKVGLDLPTVAAVITDMRNMREE
jgi:hypothetical protein